MSFPIVFSTDENYIIPTYVAVHSLLRHINPNTDITIFILYSGITEKQKKYFYELSNKIHFLEVKINNLHLNKELSYISIATYYRFFIPDLFKEHDKCLYLDSDIVVKQDISPLLKTPIEKYTLMGVRNYFSKENNSEFYKERCDSCGLKSLDFYINAGVLLINLKELRRNNLIQAMIEDANSNSYIYNDQDVLNKHCEGKIGLLSVRYNFMVQYLKNIKVVSKVLNENILDIIRAPVIIHYSTKKKPWKYKGYLMADLWQEEVDAIPSQIKKEFINVFIKESKRDRNLKERILDDLKFVYRKFFLKSFSRTIQTKFRLTT
jgi:lipopolysaccharide biosynthesis glycosyltransferase